LGECGGGILARPQAAGDIGKTLGEPEGTLGVRGMFQPSRKREGILGRFREIAGRIFYPAAGQEAEAGWAACRGFSLKE
jgi:hypothetical protein